MHPFEHCQQALSNELVEQKAHQVKNHPRRFPQWVLAADKEKLIGEIVKLKSLVAKDKPLTTAQRDKFHMLVGRLSSLLMSRECRVLLRLALSEELFKMPSETLPEDRFLLAAKYALLGKAILE